MASPDGSGPVDRSIVLPVVLGGSIERTDIPRLCERASALLASGDVDVLVCDLAPLLEADAVAIDALARLQLTAGRRGRRMRVRGACGEIRSLATLMGLDEVLSLGESRIESRREPEEGEQRRRVEEERDAGDPAG